jgi:uncharacterized protein
MKQIIIFSLLLLSMQLYAQRNPAIVNSGQVIKKGIELHDDGEYKKAIAKYLLVPENDTNYQLACYEASLSARLDENFKDAIKYARNGLNAVSDGHLDMDLYANLGSAYDENKQYDEGLKVFDTIIAKFPNSANGYYNKGICYTLQKKYDQAVEYYEKALQVNPYSPGAHFYYGKHFYQTGNLVPAYVALSAYLAITPNGNARQGAILMLNNMATSSDSFINNQKQKVVYTKMPDFSESEEIVRSKMALNNSYKAKSSMNDVLFKQLQAILDINLKNLDNDDFFTQYYLKIFNKIVKADAYEAMTYQMVSSLDIDEVKRYVKKNDKELSAFKGVLVECLNKIGFNRSINKWEDVDFKGVGYHFNNLVVFGKGVYDYEKGVKKGPWEVYDRFGRLEEKNIYNASGKLSEVSTTYYPSGVKRYEISFANDKLAGPYKTFYPNGNLKVSANIVNEKKNGQFLEYYATGQLREENNYTMDKLNGANKEYWKNGQLRYEANYINDKYNGSVTRYYMNGTKELEYTFKMGEKEGPFKEYYADGKLEMEGVYKNDKKNGVITTYHTNGKIKEKEVYENGDLNGVVINYGENGSKRSEINYKDGKMQGNATYYDADGKVWCEEVFNKGHYKMITYFNTKTGAVIQKQEVNDKNVNALVIYDRVGIKSKECIVDRDGEYNGAVKLFHENGKVRSESNYEKGKQEGRHTNYFLNGKKMSEYFYLEDKLDGTYNKWYVNGKLETEGNYLDDEQQGDWYTYTNDGLQDEDNYYNGGNDEGITNYYLNNKLFKKRIIRDDVPEKDIYYDTLGNIFREVNLLNQPEIVIYDVANQVLSKRTRVNNIDKGTLTYYYPDGSINTKSNTNGNVYEGLSTTYSSLGVKVEEGSYLNGNKHGAWKTYDNKGRLNTIYYYYQDNLVDSSITYHDNGKPDVIIHYENDVRQGFLIRTTPNGELQYKIYFDEGTAIYYTYEDASGKLVEPIYFKNGGGKLKTYFRNGKVAAEIDYEASTINGDLILYYSNGNLMKKEKCIYNDTDGPYIYNFENGKVNIEANYKYDVINGVYKLFNDKGTIEVEENYLDGVRHGVQKYYNESGKLIQKDNYYHGQLLKIEKF